MNLSISTHWNAAWHESGEGVIDDVLALGVDAVELGYNLRIDQVPGVRTRVNEGAVKVYSVHNYCPTPVGAPHGHPELFLMSAREQRTRDSAVLHISNTIQFAAEMGADVVVIHAAGFLGVPSAGQHSQAAVNASWSASSASSKSRQ